MAVTDSRLKICYRCKEEKAAESFGMASRSKDGKKSYCKACHNAANAASRNRNPGPCREASRRWVAANSERVAERKRRWIEANPGRMQELVVGWRNRNQERVAETMAALRRTPEYRVRRAVASRIRNLLGGKHGRSTAQLVGYTHAELKVHLERQFSPGMSWDNYGEWHIDHIVPLASFGIESIDDPAIRLAWALTNLRPLWAKDNRQKHAKRTHLI